MPPTDELPGNPGATPSGNDQAVLDADKERADREKDQIASGDVGDPTKLGITGTPRSGEYESTTSGQGGGVSANEGGTGATTDRAVGSSATANNNGVADANATNADANKDDQKKLDLQGALAVPGNDEDSMPDVDLAGVRNLGQAILSEALQTMHSVALTEDEAGQARRAAEVLAYTSIAAIGLTDAQREHLVIRGERAQTTLLNIAAGKSVQTRQRARDVVVQVIRRFFSDAIAVVGKIAVA